MFRLIPEHMIFRNISASFRNESSLFQNESCIALIGSIPDCLPHSGKDLALFWKRFKAILRFDKAFDFLMNIWILAVS